jgi:hypothetical protein
MLVLGASGAGACASISGLGAYGSGCSKDCDASVGRAADSKGSAMGADGTFDATATDDTIGAGDSASTDDSALNDDGTSVQDDATEPGLQDSGGGEQDSSGTPDSGSSMDAVSETGCGSTETVENCGACGVACNTTTGAPMCGGSSCSYTCNTLRQNCNTAAPNTGGCECTGTGCCATNCQTTHSTGTGEDYYDCTSTGTINETQAKEACATFTGDAGACSSSQVGCNCLLVLCSSQAQSVCGVSGGTCNCWQYSGPNEGKVESSSDTSHCSASCGSSSDPGWN